MSSKPHDMFYLLIIYQSMAKDLKFMKMSKFSLKSQTDPLTILKVQNGLFSRIQLDQSKAYFIRSKTN